MDDKERDEFSWTGLFAVTGFCFLLFGLVLKFLDGLHVNLFMKIGIGALVLAFISTLNDISKKRVTD